MRGRDGVGVGVGVGSVDDSGSVEEEEGIAEGGTEEIKSSVITTI